VSNADRKRLVWMAFEVEPDGTLGRSRVLYDGTRSLADRRGTADGLKVDMKGNIFGAGPGSTSSHRTVRCWAGSTSAET
jgi:gluconolactonase